MKLLHTFFLLLLTTGIAAAKDKNMSLTEALRSGIVSLKATATGNACYEEGLLFEIENKGKKALDVFIEPGLIFTSDDTVAPPLLVAGGLHILLKPAAPESRTFQTFAYEAGAVNPGKGVVYHYKNQADSNVLRTLAYTQQHPTPAALTQKAIWVWTSHKALHTVYEPADAAASTNLIRFLAITSHQGLPLYYSYFELNSTVKQAVTPSRPLRIYAVVMWKQADAGNMTLAVYNEKDSAVQVLFGQQAFQPGSYAFNARFESASVPSGRYTIRLRSATATLTEIPVIIE